MAVLSSCGKDVQAQEDFKTACPTVGLTVSGVPAYEFSDASVQMSFNESKRQFRVSDDSMKYYYVLTVDKLPQGLGSTFTGDVVWTTNVDVRKRSGLKFKVINMSGDLMWVWNKKNDIGLVVRYVR